MSISNRGEPDPFSLFEYLRSQIDINREEKEINACYNEACSNETSIALKGKASGQIHFYCKNCADMMMTCGLYTIIAEKRSN